MAWKALDRQSPLVPKDAPPALGEAVRRKIAGLFARYPHKRAALLGALHIVQDALGHVPPQAQVEVAELLDLRPADVADTISFYTHYWTKPKGRKVIVVCRSISCEVMGANPLLEAIKDHLGIDEHETTPDGEFSLVTEECLALCEYAPAMLIGERIHANVRPEDVPRILSDPDCDKIDVPRSDLFDAPKPEAVTG